MSERRSIVVLSALVAVLTLTVPVAYATSYSLTVGTDLPSYTYRQTVKVSGAVAPAPGSSTAVVVRVFNPTMQLVVAGQAPVAASSGSYNFTFVTGGSAAWTPGTYTVNATWGAYPPTISKAATFGYTGATTTTTTSTSSTTSTTTSASSTSTTTTSSSSAVSTSSSSVVSTSSTPTSTSSSSVTSVSSSTTSSTSVKSSSSSSSGGGIPEFPFQASFAGVVLVVILVGYLLARRAATQRPIISPVR